MRSIYAMFILFEHDNIMNKRTPRENEILTQALGALATNLPPEFKIEVPTLPEPPFQGGALIRFRTPGETLEFIAEIKPTVPKPHRLLYYIQKERLCRILLVTRYVNPVEADEMKKEGLQFIDTAGNAYFNQQGVFVFIKGNRPRPELVRTGRTPVFQAAGLKMIFALLCEPQLLAATYREIAIAAGVALGTVGFVMTDLKQRGFLIHDKPAGQKLINKKELFERWVTGYIQKLRPKLALGKFKGEDQWWDRRQLEGGVWGGEVAAAKFTQYLRPEIATMYTAPDKMHEIVLKHRLKKDPEGNIELLRKFWKRSEPFPGLAHPILAYADLLAIGNQRDLETARVLYDKEIFRFIGED